MRNIVFLNSEDTKGITSIATATEDRGSNNNNNNKKRKLGDILGDYTRSCGAANQISQGRKTMKMMLECEAHKSELIADIITTCAGMLARIEPCAAMPQRGPLPVVVSSAVPCPLPSSPFPSSVPCPLPPAVPSPLPPSVVPSAAAMSSQEQDKTTSCFRVLTPSSVVG